MVAGGFVASIHRPGTRPVAIVTRTRFIILLLLCLLPATVPADTKRIALFIPHTGNFWGDFADFAKAAADDIGAELSIHVAGRSPQHMLAQVRAVASEGIDGILFSDYAGVGKEILEIAEASKTPALLVNAALLDPDIVPRSHYRYWIGGVSPDDRQAGVRLATGLIDAARAKGASQFNILAYAGSRELPMQRRLEGLHAIADARSDVNLIEALPINDGATAVVEAFDAAREQHPELNIVWSFYDNLALFAARHNRELGTADTIAFGGINWTPESLDGLDEGLIDVDIGGHIFDGAQGVIMLFDYLNGHDFADERLLFESNMVAANQANVGLFKRILRDPYAIDYRALSKTHNRTLRQYRFDLDEIAAQPGLALDLTTEERKWIKANSPIRVGAISDWPPFDSIDADGNYSGVTRDYLDLIARKTGLTFDYRIDTWSNLLDAIKQHSVDLLGSVYYTAERDRTFNFSPPYLEVLDYFFVRDDLGVRSIADLNGKRVAMPKDYALSDLLRKHFPDIRIVDVASEEDAIEAVLERRADALYDSYAVLNYLLKRNSISSIVPFKSTRYLGTNHLHLVTDKGDAMLASILNKGLEAVSPQEALSIYDRWLGSPPPLTTEDLHLTDAERRWLSQHPRIRVRVARDWPPYDFVDIAGRARGLSVDVLRMIQQRLGLEVEFVNAPWTQALDDIRTHATDVVVSIAETPRRQPFMLFSEPYIAPRYVVYTRNDAPPVTDMRDLDGRTVVVEKGFRLHEILEDNYPTIGLKVVATTADALRTLSFGQADAYIGNQGTVNWISEENVLTNLRMAHIPHELGTSALRFAVRDDWPELRKLIDKVLAIIPDIEMQQARRRWVGALAEPNGLVLSASERRWLQDHPVIRFAGDPNWLPYEAIDQDGKYVGIVADHLDLLAQRLGIEFSLQPTSNWIETVKLAREGGVDMISETDSSDLRHVLKFTQSYLTSPVVIVMRDDAPFVEDIAQISDRRIGVIREYGYVPAIRRSYPALDYVDVESIQDGLTAVSTGRIDALFATLAQASYHIGELGINNVHIVGKTPFDTRLAFGVQPALAPLIPLLNRALDTITSAEKQSILDAWGRQKFVARIDYWRITQVVLVALGILLAMLAWALVVRRQKDRLRLSEERFQAAMEAVSEAIWEWDLANDRRHFSAGFFTHLGYSPEEVPVSNAQWMALLHPDDRKSFETAIHDHLGSPDHGASPLPLQYRVRNKQGDFVRVESRGKVVAWDAHGAPILRRGTLRDISEQYRQKEALRISEERFQLALQAANVGLWDWNAETGGVYYSPLWMTMLGYGHHELPHTFQTFRELLHPDDRDDTLANNERMLNDPGAKYEQEFRLRTKDGSYRWILSRGHVFSRDGAGKAVRALGIHSDITRRKETELEVRRLNQNLQAANQRFAMAARAISLGVWERINDGSDRMTFDERMLEIYGFEPCESVSMREWLERVHPDDRKTAVGAVRDVLNGDEDVHVDFRIHRTDGALRHIYAAATAVRGSDGSPDQFFGVNWDITSLKANEEDLKVFRRFAEKSSVGFGMAHPDSRIVYVNEALNEMVGDARAMAMYGESFDRFYPPEDQERLRKEIIPTVLEQGEWSGELMMYRQDGQEFPTQQSFFVVDDGHGRPAYIGDVIADLSERKLAEEQFQRVVNALPVAVAIAGADGHILLANPQAVREFGEGASIIGMNTSHFYSRPGQREHILEKVARDGQLLGEEVQYRARDGSLIEGLLSAIPIVFDGQTAMLGVVVNITERRRMEVALAEARDRALEANRVKGILLANVEASEEKFRTLVANIPGTIYRCMPRHPWHMLFISDGIRNLSGYPAEDFTGDNPRRTFAELMHPEDIEPIAENTARAIEERRPYVNEYRVIDGNGDTHWVYAKGQAIYGADGEPKYLDGTIFDISDRHRMEQELARAKEQAEQANRFKGQFLANMSHEIRTPMNAIVGLGHLLNRTQLSLQQQDYLGKIQVSASSLLSLIDDILDLSKIDAGQLRIEHIDFDLGEVLDNIATMASTRLAEKPVEFVYDVGSAVPGRLHGDPHRLAQILTNLVGNATKFTEKGSIVVRIHASQEADPLRLQFTVEDSGVGISAEKIEQLFEPFTQADGSTTREYGGTGLGLSICRQLCELMNGTIHAESTPGAGSRFTFELPFGVAAPLPERQRFDAGNLRVLLVDDNTITRQVLGDLLLSLSFRVDVASSGEAALKRIVGERRPYDLLLIDWRMPGLDGIATANAVRDSDLDVQPRIILMTAYGRAAMDAGLELGRIDGFLVKPITPSHLLDAVANAMRPEHGAQQDPSRAVTGEPLHRLHGKVLLVEDNPINQQVAREILQQMGLEVRVAGSGMQCLEMVVAERPDLVLMDIQMPDMDGYETTAHIRQSAGLGSLPILAMTANAMSGDADRSLDAGMNGHITKPVDPVRLHRTLQAWLERGAEGSPPPDGPRESDDSTDRTGTVRNQFDNGAIDFATGLMRVGGNQALYARLLDDFSARFADTTAGIESACRHEDCDRAERALHTLKGVAGNIGASAVQQIVTMLERHARSSDIAAVRSGLPSLALALSQARDAARIYVDSNAAAGEPSPDALDAADVGEWLAELQHLIGSGDATSLQRAKALAGVRLSDAARPLHRQLCTELEDYDFDAAAATLAELVATIDAEQPPHAG